MPQSENAPALDDDNRYLIPPDYQIQNLSAPAQRIIWALTQGVVPKRIQFDFDYRRELVGFVDQFIGYLPKLVRLVFPLGLRVINWSSFFSFGRPVTLLKSEQVEKHIHNLMDNPIYLVREGVKAIKGLALMGFYSHPEVHRHLGYLPQPWLDQKTAERVSRFGLRVPDLHEIAEAPGGPAGVKISGNFDEQLVPGEAAPPYRQAWTKASEAEIEAALRAAEAAKAQAQSLGELADEERAKRG